MLRLICLNQNTYTGLNILREVFVYGLIESVMKLLLKYHRVFLMDAMWLFWRPYRYLKEWERHFVCTRWMLSRSPTASLDCSSRVTLSLHFFPKNNHPHAWKFVLTVKCTITQTEEMTVYVCFHLFANGCVLFKPNVSIQLTHSLALITSIWNTFWKFYYLLIFYYFYDFFFFLSNSILHKEDSKF